MKTIALLLGYLTGFFVVVSTVRLLSRREPTENVEGAGGASA